MNPYLEEALDHIEGWLSPAEGRQLADLAAQVEPNQTIVELGSWKGKSACWLAAGSRDGKGAKVYAVDHWLGSPETSHHFPSGSGYTTFAEFDTNVRRFGLEDLIIPVTGLTTAVASTWHHKIGLLFIDAGHDYENVRADFLAWTPYLEPGCHLAFHDSGYPDIARLLTEEVKDSPNWRPIADYPLPVFRKT